MKTIVTLILFLALSNLTIYSQLINNKLDICFSAGISSPIGDKLVNEAGYITPSLFNNFGNGFNMQLKSTYKLFSYLDIGLQLKNTRLKGWNNADSTGIYKDANVKIRSVGAVFKIGTKLAGYGFFNRFGASLSIVPTYNFVSVKLDQSIFEVVSGTSDNLLKSKVSSIGADCIVNMKYSVNQRYAFFAEFGMSYLPVKSALYNDSRVLLLNADMGVSFKLMKDKHFNYH